MSLHLHYSLTDRPSNSELQDTLSDINTKIESIDKQISFYKTNNPKLDRLKELLESKPDTQATKSKNALREYLDDSLECTAATMGVDEGANSCADVTAMSQNLTKALKREADSRSNVGEFTWSPANKAAHINSLIKLKEDLEQKRQLIHAELGKIDPLVGGVLNMDSLAVASLVDSHKDDQWMSFEFDSSSYEKNSDYTNKHSSMSTQSGVNFGFISGSWGHSHSGQQTESQQEIAKASLKVKAKLLRVFIKRPWFKPEFFDDRNLNFVSYALGTLH